MKNSLIKKMDYLIRKPLPILKNTVFFQSFGGQYNDNPKYISENLHDRMPDVKIVWAVYSQKSEVNAIPSYVKQVLIDSKEYIKYSCRSQVIVDNMIGVRAFLSKRNRKVLAALFKSNRQLNISTWHGTPIKKIGLDMKDAKSRNYYLTSADYLISGCEYTREKLERAFYPIKVVNCGTPRNDLLVNEMPESRRLFLKKRLGLPENKKIILFAPTFRDSIEYSGVYQMEHFDIAHILELLKKKFPGTEWVFVFRVHHEVLKKIDVERLTKFYSGIVFNGNLHDDMAEYLAVTDALITDYSGSIFDFALTQKPGFLFVPDKYHYINEERGVYINLEELPYSNAESLNGFYNLISAYDEIESRERIKRFNINIGNSETGRASEFLASEIINFMNTGKKGNKV